ncbi:MAG: hypothetical protein LC777_21045 [Actinobacteria bacterium]|nr:hypothetical protein [Actinomycetota bacterium]
MAPRFFALLMPLLVVSAFMAAPAAAQASQNAYSTPAGEVQVDVSASHTAPTTHASNHGPGDRARLTSAAQLPFTGLDVGLMLAVGAMLLLVGVGISRLSRRTQ